MNQFGTVDEYLKACDQLSKEGRDARIYQSAGLALYDVVHSLIHFMPHKNKIAVVAQGSHLLEVATSLALKNQNQIIYKKPHENIITFLETLDTHTHFVYWASEHEVTGEILYNQKQQEEILSVLNRKKIFSIQLTHNSQMVMPFAAGEVSFAVVIQTPTIFKNHQENSVVYYSEKQKIPFGIATLQNRAVLDRPLTTATAEERAVISIKETSALAIKEYLKLSNQDAFVAADYPFWVTDKWANWWPEAAQPHFLEHLLVLSADYIKKNSNYLEKIAQAEQKIKPLSSWKI